MPQRHEMLSLLFTRSIATPDACPWRIRMFQQNQQIGNLVATDVAPILRRDEGPDLAGHSPSHRRRSSPREDLPNSPPELMSESPGLLLVEFCKGHTSISR